MSRFTKRRKEQRIAWEKKWETHDRCFQNFIDSLSRMCDGFEYLEKNYLGFKDLSIEEQFKLFNKHYKKQ